MIKITKKEMVDILTSSPAWDGTKNKKILLKNYTYREIKDIYIELDEAENDYFSSRFAE